MFKTVIKKLESYMDKKYPEFRAKFYINRSNKLIHVGMDTDLFDKNNYRLYLWDCEWFMKENIPNVKFEFFRVPSLINCTKWKLLITLLHVERQPISLVCFLFVICYL